MPSGRSGQASTRPSIARRTAGVPQPARELYDPAFSSPYPGAEHSNGHAHETVLLSQGCVSILMMNPIRERRVRRISGPTTPCARPYIGEAFPSGDIAGRDHMTRAGLSPPTRSRTSSSRRLQRSTV